MATSKKQTIIRILETEQRPLTPKEISWISKMDKRFESLNRNTVRVYCRHLLRDGKIQQPLHGYYEVTETKYGVGLGAVRVHDLRLVWDVGLRRRVFEFDEVVGGVRVRVTFGSKRGKVAAMVACDEGMDFHTVCFAVDLIRRLAWEKAGINLDPVECEVCCEFNEDYQRIRLDGVKCVTVQSFLGDLERIYNKEDVLRSEIKVEKTDLTTMYAMLKGGVTPYNIVQMQFMLVQKLDRISANLDHIVKELRRRG